MLPLRIMPSIVRHTASTLCCTTSLTMTSFSHLISHASTYAKDPYEYANLGKCKPCCSTVAVQLFIVFLHSLPFFRFSPPIHSTLCTYHKNGRIAAAFAGTKSSAAAVVATQSDVKQTAQLVRGWCLLLLRCLLPGCFALFSALFPLLSQGLTLFSTIPPFWKRTVAFLGSGTEA